MTRILIIAPAWVGDMVMTQSLVARLLLREPEAVIDLVAPVATSVLGARMPGVHRTFPIDSVHGRSDLLRRVQFGLALRKEKFDRAFVLQRTMKNALIPLAAGIPRRRGYVGEFRYGVLNEVRHRSAVGSPRTVEIYVTLADEPGDGKRVVPRPILTVDPDNARAMAAKLGLATGGPPVVALCPGAEYGPAKRWPAAHFAALAKILARKGFATWIFGSAKEAEIGETVRAFADIRDRALAPVNLIGRTSLVDALDLLSLTAGAVANDSGLMHIAAAIGRPVVAVYGSTPSIDAPPLTDRGAIVEIALPCRPCYQRVCPLGHLDCLNLISAAEVGAKLLDVMGGPVAGERASAAHPA